MITELCFFSSDFSVHTPLKILESLRFKKLVSYANQACIYLIKTHKKNSNFVKYYLNFK